MEIWVEEIESWDDQPFSGGYGGLHDLADHDFSGAVSTGGTWLFMVNGRVVAVVQNRQTADGNEVVDADIERFEDASGTAYEAPDPSIPLLVAMKTRGGEKRGRYYSVRTPVDEVADTLESGGFTGYVELSENVLSGDYYTVYQAGRSMDLAFIGNARRLLTDEEAHDRMADEVGIYEVIAVDLDVVDIPGDGGDTGAGAAGAAGAVGAGASAADTGAANPNPAASTTSGAAADSMDDADESAADATATEATDGSGDTDTAVAASDGHEPDPDNGDSGSDTDVPNVGGPVDASGSTWDDSRDSADAATGGSTDDEPAVSESATDDTSTAANSDSGDASAAPGPTTESGHAETVPSLDPEHSSTSDRWEPADSAPDATASTEAARSSSTAAPDEMADLRAELADTRAELEATREERDDLAARVEELEARIAQLESGGSSGPSLSVAEAFAGTSLFVRYASKGKLTVEDAHDGAGTHDELLENLQLDRHTQFESAGATVGGRPFDDWLASTDRFRFARWLVSTLVFEIRETGSVDAMRELYDALPEIDRIEFEGTVGVESEAGEESLEFDVVVRNRMGEPLVVATLEDSRDPVAEASMAGLVNDATAVVQSHEPLAGAFYVTSAFFAPEALETAREATSGSLLSRDRRKSYVKLSRSRGYYLGLVESREETFRLSVPDL